MSELQDFQKLCIYLVYIVSMYLYTYILSTHVYTKYIHSYWDSCNSDKILSLIMYNGGTTL